MGKAQEIKIKGNIICTDKNENSWGILTSSINDEPRKVIIVDGYTGRDEHGKLKKIDLSTVVVGLEVLLDRCGTKKVFDEGDDIEITIKY